MNRLKSLLLILSFSSLLYAETDSEPWSVRAGYGYSDANDLGQIITFNPKPHPSGTSAGLFDVGYRFIKESWGLPIDIYLKGGVNRFFENGIQADFFEVTAFVKAFWKFQPWGNTIRVGAGEGASYALGIPTVERLEAEKEGDHNSRFLNYLDISLDFDAGRLVRFKPLYGTYVGYALKHRSGIYGAINSVRRGGSNYNIFYLEHTF